jgi:hypothetical protein
MDKLNYHPDEPRTIPREGTRSAGLVKSYSTIIGTHALSVPPLPSSTTKITRYVPGSALNVKLKTGFEVS